MGDLEDTLTRDVPHVPLSSYHSSLGILRRLYCNVYAIPRRSQRPDRL